MTNPTNPTVIKKEQCINLFFSKTGNISELCKAMGIHRSTFYEWINTDKDFKEKIEAEKESLIDFAESKLFNLMNEKNITAIIFFLKSKGKERGYWEKHSFEGAIPTYTISEDFLPKLKSDGNSSKPTPEPKP